MDEGVCSSEVFSQRMDWKKPGSLYVPRSAVHLRQGHVSELFVLPQFLKYRIDVIFKVIPLKAKLFRHFFCGWSGLGSEMKYSLFV